MTMQDEIIPTNSDICRYLDSGDWKGLALYSDSSAREKLDYNIASKLGVLPLKITGLNNKQTLIVAIPAGEEQDQLIKAVAFATGLPVSPTYGNAQCIQKAIFFAYRGCETHIEQAIEDVALGHIGILEETSPPHTDTSETSAVPKLLKILIERAINLNASDIHIEAGKEAGRVRLRIDGVLREEKKINISKYACCQLIRRIKVLSKLDTTKQHECLEGAFGFENNAWSMRLRVSIMPTLFGEKAVIRLLDNRFLDELLRKESGGKAGIFNALGLKGKDASQLMFHLGANEGVIITTGPTGSGKSTLLYACLEYLNSPNKNIVSIEDPVERVIGGINQIEISEQNGMSAQVLLKGILRQDPDILLVGEVRDADVAAAAMVGGITGHLVLTSLHAANCVEALNRFLQLGIEKQLIASALRLIVSQRLLAKNCPHCLKGAQPSQELRRLLNIGNDMELYESIGCERCAGTGVLGRICVFEQIGINGKLQEAICSEHSGNFKKTALDQGYMPLVFSIRGELMGGTISPETALCAMGLAPEIFL